MSLFIKKTKEGKYTTYKYKNSYYLITFILAIIFMIIVPVSYPNNLFFETIHYRLLAIIPMAFIPALIDDDLFYLRNEIWKGTKFEKEGSFFKTSP